jgi:acyl carrier protein
MQDNPLVERIFAVGVESQESGSGGHDWRGKIQAASAEDRNSVIGEAVRDVVGTVLRVKPDSLRNDQPLTDLGLDSLMGVEIETMLESSIGVALPPTSLMRARTIGQIATLIAGEMGGDTDTAQKAKVFAEVVETSELDLDAISDDDLDLLLGGVNEEVVAGKG